MEWDKIKMAQQFLSYANALHPEEARSEGRFEEELARQELYYECYMSSFTKEKLTEVLNGIVAGKVSFPEEKPDDLNEEKYTKAYAQEAQAVLRKLEKN